MRLVLFVVIHDLEEVDEFFVLGVYFIKYVVLPQFYLLREQLLYFFFVAEIEDLVVVIVLFVICSMVFHVNVAYQLFS